MTEEQIRKIAEERAKALPDLPYEHEEIWIEGYIAASIEQGGWFQFSQEEPDYHKLILWYISDDSNGTMVYSPAVLKHLNLTDFKWCYLKNAPSILEQGGKAEVEERNRIIGLLETMVECANKHEVDRYEDIFYNNSKEVIKYLASLSSTSDTNFHCRDFKNGKEHCTSQCDQCNCEAWYAVTTPEAQIKKG